MRLYFDTAYIAKCYLNEPDGREVRKFARRASGLYSSNWCVAELARVFLRHVRERSLTDEEGEKVRDAFLEDVRNGVWNLLPLSDRLVFKVEAYIRSSPSDLYLRAGDAAHLVTARESGFEEIWSNDSHLLAAARFFGLSGRSIDPGSFGHLNNAQSRSSRVARDAA